MKTQADELNRLRTEIGRVLVGQEELVTRLLIALLCRGHVLIEGVPGLAKTLTVSVLAQTIKAAFNRIQFTPDLLPGDLIGTLVYNPKSGEFTPHKGPIFANLLLADEINRSPAKVQSALLEAMQERQVTIGDETYPLAPPFMVLATQNPIEQEGTYQLPEAQMDRFLFKLTVNYPSLDEEHTILKRMGKNAAVETVDPVITPERILEMQAEVDRIHLKENLERYILHIVDATRHPDQYGLSEARDWILHGASPRASINLSLAARAHAMLDQRDFVTPRDIQSVAPDILRHRIALTYKAEAQHHTSDELVRKILDRIEVPAD